MTPRSVVALGGEGIGPEVIDATCELMIKAGMPVEITTPPHGEPAIKSHGHGMPDATKRACESADGVLFGAAGARRRRPWWAGSGGRWARMRASAP